MDVDSLRTLTVEDVAQVLGVGPETVRIWIREGALEAMRWGRRFHVRAEAVRAFQDARQVNVPRPAETVRRLRQARAARLGRRGQGDRPQGRVAAGLPPARAGSPPLGSSSSPADPVERRT